MSRVTELDADILDREFLAVIKDGLERCLQDLSLGHRWQYVFRMVKMALPLLYYAHLVTRGYTVGQSLLGTHFDNFTASKRILLFILAYLAPSICTYVSEESTHSHLHSVTRKLQALSDVAGLVHFYIFLYIGGPATLSRRILGLQMTVPDNIAGQGNNTMVNRELLGHCVANVISTLKPLVEVARNWAGRQTALNLESDSEFVCCAKCGDVAIVPLLATKSDNSQVIFCNFCYHVAKQHHKFSTVTLLYSANKQQ